MYWLIDFDDTLAVGPNTWALTRVLPDMIDAHGLPFDETRFTAASLEAQRLANETNNDEVILDEMFRQLGWPTELKRDLLTRMYNEYVPSLYEDTRPFLEQLAGEIVFLVSNNDHAPQLAQQLGIASYFNGIFTPQLCDSARAKPQRDMWDYVVAQGLADAGEKGIVVGDDPWSEGAFADACGFDCWIIDRLERYTNLNARYPYHWGRSLLDIEKSTRHSNGEKSPPTSDHARHHRSRR
jgi:HAD superfamily hydrolase (TIGR01549 family)